MKIGLVIGISGLYASMYYRTAELLPSFTFTVTSLCATGVGIDLAITSLFMLTVLAMADDVFLDGSKCSTYLEYCARRGNLFKVKFLLTHEANVKETHEGRHLPALYAAIEGGNLDVIKEIIKKGGRLLERLPLSELRKKAAKPNSIYNLDAIAFAEKELAAIEQKS